MSESREPGLADSVAKHSALVPSALNSRAEIAAVSLLTIAGAGLRLSHLGSKSIWLDEAITLQLARMPLKEFSASWWHGDAAYQSLYYLLMRLWSPGNYSEFWIRLPSAILGVAAIPLIYLVTKKLSGTLAALASAALLTFSATAVYYSQEARSYTLAIFLVLLSYQFFLRAVERDRRRDWLLWSVCSILTVYAHNFAVLALLAQLLALLFDERPLPWRRVFSYGLLIAAGVAPALSYVFRVPAERLQYSWMPNASPRELLQLAMFLGGSHLRFILVLVLWCAGTIAILRAGRARDRKSFWHGAVVLLWFILPIALMALISSFHPVFMQRYMIFSLPAALILTAIGAESLRQWHAGWLLVIVLCTSSAIAVFKQFHEPREDWRAATNMVLAAAQPGDAILFSPDYLALPFNYYRDRRRQPPKLQVFSTQPAEAAKAASSTSDFDPRQFHHVWIVQSGELSDLDALRRPDSSVVGELQTRYGSPQISRFKDITVLRFPSSVGSLQQK
jgi:mannosyltransferase